MQRVPDEIVYWAVGAVAVATVKLWHRVHGVAASDKGELAAPYRAIADVVLWPVIAGFLLFVGMLAVKEWTIAKLSGDDG
jgi:hypothetical protein